MSDAWSAVCATEGTESLDVESVCAPRVSAHLNPIDLHRSKSQQLLAMGQPDALQQTPTLGRLLVIGLVAATEEYMRSVVAGVLRVCPYSRSESAPQMVSLGAVDYYEREELARGIYEHVSFATASEVVKRTNSILGINTQPSSSLFGALREFDRLCQLRHACAHSDGFLGHSNLRELGARRGLGAQIVTISFASLQSAGAICYNTVRAYNRHVFRAVVERWLAEGEFEGSWTADRDRFSALFKLFRSRSDSIGPSNAYHAYRTLPLET